MLKSHFFNRHKDENSVLLLTLPFFISLCEAENMEIQSVLLLYFKNRHALWSMLKSAYPPQIKHGLSSSLHQQKVSWESLILLVNI